MTGNVFYIVSFACGFRVTVRQFICQCLFFANGNQAEIYTV